MLACVFLYVPRYYLVNAHLKHIPLGLTFAVALLSGCCSGVSGPNLRAIILNVNEPETRGVALALQVSCMAQDGEHAGRQARGKLSVVLMGSDEWRLFSMCRHQYHTFPNMHMLSKDFSGT